MMMQLVIQLLFTPVCALLAGAILWLVFRNETLDDSALIRNFVFMLALFTGTGIGVLRTEAVRLRIDPVFRIQHEIETHPLYMTIAAYAPDDAQALRRTLEAEMAGGASLADALRVARPMLWAEVKYRSGFADQTTRLQLARYVTDTLIEFGRSDPGFCHRILTEQPFDRAMLLERFTPENSAVFQDIAIRVYESADRGMRHEERPSEKHAEFNTVAREYSAIQEEIEERFGRDIANLLRSDRIRSTPIDLASRVCAARIYQLEAMQKRPKEIASRLTDSIVRS